jgi:putative ABC transport system substrate-binding protein
MPMDQSPSEPVMIPASPLALRDRATIAHLLLKRGTPSICAFREVMEAGALMSYGVNLVDVFRDIAAFADQVARGAKAGDVPMRAPSHFHTAFNLKTAKALGLDTANAARPRRRGDRMKRFRLRGLQSRQCD